MEKTRSAAIEDLPPAIPDARSANALYPGWTRSNLRYEHRIDPTRAVFFCKWCSHYAVKRMTGVKTGRTKSCGCLPRNGAAWVTRRPNGQGSKAVKVC